ncbi:venom factor [Caerostris extrusa]|uniref:Venom factor n=1 Tax=Caerostris extrusa TaxID=172846 RepID=A0AAV4NLR7_CAEEX|nr:venom factor [Caerostris extrusa]
MLKPSFGKDYKKGPKKQAGNNSKVILKVYVPGTWETKIAGMSIIDVGIFSGFEASPEDLEELQRNPEHLIEQYETSSKGIVFYLKTVPKEEKYCFNFDVIRQYIVGKTQRSIIKVYDYYNPDATCSILQDKLRILACDKYDYVWKGIVSKESEKQDGFFKISFEIQDVIKEGIEKRNLMRVLQGTS